MGWRWFQIIGQLSIATRGNAPRDRLAPVVGTIVDHGESALSLELMSASTDRRARRSDPSGTWGRSSYQGRTARRFCWSLRPCAASAKTDRYLPEVCRQE